MIARLCRRKRLLLAMATLLLLVVACLYLFLAVHPSETDDEAGVVQPRDRQAIRRGVEALRRAEEKGEEEEEKEVNYNVHTFYYAWYGNPKYNGKWIHWNHQRLPHWNRVVGKSFSTEAHLPPDDIGANFYPELGLYSFMDSTAIETHFRQIQQAGIGVVVVSWYPKHMADDQGVPSDFMVERLLHHAHKFRLKLALHIEPYARRDVVNLRRHLRFLMREQNLTSHPAYLHRNSRPVVYVYDSYRTPFQAWARLLTRRGDLSVRGTELDAYFVGLYFLDGDCARFGAAGFDGAYSYFGIDGFTSGSRTSNWKAIVRACDEHKVEFIPCVAPGYDDTAVRPWNSGNTREREHGRYYRIMFEKAIEARAPVIAVTSFNEWHEGTQIEPAVPKQAQSVPRRIYQDYSPNPPDFYLHMTRALVDRFAASWTPARAPDQ